MITFINSVNGDCDLLGRFINTNSSIIDAWEQHIHKLYIQIYRRQYEQKLKHPNPNLTRGYWNM